MSAEDLTWSGQVEPAATAESMEQSWKKNMETAASSEKVTASFIRSAVTIWTNLLSKDTLRNIIILRRSVAYCFAGMKLPTFTVEAATANPFAEEKIPESQQNPAMPEFEAQPITQAPAMPEVDPEFQYFFPLSKPRWCKPCGL
eukprot:179278-Amphidinium_carterae.1